ncbi:MAG: septation protein A [Hyphomonadaceae bacterium]
MPETVEKPKARGANLIVDLGPVALFMIAYNVANRMAPPGAAIYWATGVFMAATLAALAYARVAERRTPPMLLVTATVVLVFGGLTLVLHDALFIKIKPTIINLLWAGAIFGGLAFRQNVFRMLLGGAMELPERIWRVLAIRWGLLFIFLAALNEFIWRTFSEAFWANFKFFGVLPITLLFALANAPLIMKHVKTDDAPAPPPAAG